MKYKIRPGAKMQWCEGLNSTVVRIMDEQGKALSDLDWIDAEQELTPEILAIALRHGQIADDGIFVDMADVQTVNDVDSVLSAAGELHRVHRENPWMKDLDEPGRLSEVSADTLKTVQGRVDRLLEADVKPELEEHWKNLGGSIDLVS